MLSLLRPLPKSSAVPRLANGQGSSDRHEFIRRHKTLSAASQPTGSNRRVDFDGLVQALRDHWAKIASKFPSVDDITIVGIDLSKRKS
jgi:hypothetical protein